MNAFWFAGHLLVHLVPCYSLPDCCQLHTVVYTLQLYFELLVN